MPGNIQNIKVELRGAGFAAGFHCESYRQLSGMGVEVVGVFSKNAASRTKFAGSRGLRAFDSFDEMVRAVDVVDLCVPGSLHEPFCVRAAELGAT